MNLDYYEGSAAADPALSIQTVAVRISTRATGGNGVGQEGKGSGEYNNAYRTAAFHVKQFNRASCSPQWHEGHRRLCVNQGLTTLQAEVLARVERGSSWGEAGGNSVGVKQQAQQRQEERQQHRQQAQQAPQAEGMLATGSGPRAPNLAADEIVLARACIDLSAVRDGYNYVQLFSPEDAEDAEHGCVAPQSFGGKKGVKKSCHVLLCLTVDTASAPSRRENQFSEPLVALCSDWT